MPKRLSLSRAWLQPGPGQSLEQFLTIGYSSNIGARQVIDHVTAVSASLDGQSVQDLSLPPENRHIEPPLLALSSMVTRVSW